MPRRNQRHESHEPLDLTPADVRSFVKTRPKTHIDPVQAGIERRNREREAAERQRNARINGGIDWSVCLVPDCGQDLSSISRYGPRDPKYRDHTSRLPLCIDHLAVAFTQANYQANNPLMVNAVTDHLERQQAKLDATYEADKEARKSRQDGDIYYLRLNGLIKVGWSRSIYQRFKAYGPDVEVLCHYPATRTDETNLHRQLRPYLAKGREWYEDCQLIADLVTKAIEQHGPPTVTAAWTEPKQGPIGTRPAARAKKSGLSIV